MSLPLAKTKLLQMFDGLPLAISQAGRFVNSSKIGLDEYLGLYESSKHEVIEKLPFATDGAEEDTQRASIRTTWTISVNLLKQRMEKETIDGKHCHAFHHLRLLAYFEPTDFSFDIMEKGLVGNHIPDWFRQVFSSKLQFYSTIQILLDLSLLDKQTNGTSYSMHRVVHDWLCTYMARETDMQLLSLAANAVAFSAPSLFRSSWATEQQRLISHADFLLPRLKQLKSSIPFVELYKLDEKDLDKISALLKSERTDLVERFPSQPMRSICYLISAGGKVDEALAIVDSAIARLQHPQLHSPVNSQEFIALTGVRGGLLKDKKSNEKAEKAISLVLNGLPQLQLPQNMIRRQSFYAKNDLACVLYESGLTEPSVDLLESLLCECIEVYGTFHSITWLILENLDINLSELGRHAERQVILERLKPEAETAFDHEENARSTLRWFADAKVRGSNLGESVAFKEAEALYARVLNWQLKSRGEDDLAVGEIWSALSMLYKKWGRGEIVACGLEWLRICRLHWGEQHENTGWAYIDLAGIYRQLGNYTETILMYKKAIEILPKDNDTYAHLCISLSKALHAKQDEEAINFGRKALNLDISMNGMFHVYTVEDYCALGTYLQYYQKWQDARECFGKALNISRHIHNLDFEERALEGLKTVCTELGDSGGYWGCEVELEEDL